MKVGPRAKFWFPKNLQIKTGSSCGGLRQHFPHLQRPKGDCGNIFFVLLICFVLCLHSCASRSCFRRYCSCDFKERLPMWAVGASLNFPLKASSFVIRLVIWIISTFIDFRFRFSRHRPSWATNSASSISPERFRRITFKWRRWWRLWCD